MTTLHQYLEDIAVAVLRPLGYLYSTVGATEGTWGYSGIHSNLKMQGWIRVCTIEVPQYAGPDTILTVDQRPNTVAVPVYELWYTQVDGRQSSWWVKMP